MQINYYTSAFSSPLVDSIKLWYIVNQWIESSPLDHHSDKSYLTDIFVFVVEGNIQSVGGEVFIASSWNWHLTCMIVEVMVTLMCYIWSPVYCRLNETAISAIESG